MTPAARPRTAPRAAADDVRRVVLPNGLTVLLRRDASAPVVAIVTWVKAGYFDETDDVVGVAHVLEHMYFKGTPTRGVGEIAKATKMSGGFLNAATIYDHTVYYTVLPASSVSAGLDIQFDAYAHSLIDGDELARELEVIIQEAKRKADSASSVTTETLFELLHDRHRIRRWRIGREPGLRALTRNHVVGFYRNFYRPSNTILSIVGDIDMDAVTGDVERRWGMLPAGAPTRAAGDSEVAAPGFRWREWTGDIVQAQFAFGWRTPAADHPDTPLLDLAAAVLGSGRASRLYRAVRDRRLASSIGAYDYTPTEVGVFVVHGEANAEHVGDAMGAAWAEVVHLRDAGIGERELVRARRLYEARWLRRLESMDGQATYLAEWEALGDWRSGERYLTRLLEADATSVSDAIRRHLDPDNVAIVAYRPEGAPALAGDRDAARAMLAAALPRRVALDEIAEAPALVAARVVARHERSHGRSHVYRTAAGVAVLVGQRPAAPIVHLGVYLLGGAIDEPVARAGLTTLMARAAGKGSARRDAAALARAAEELGGSIGAGVTADAIGWSFSVPTHHLEAAIALLAEVVQEPAYPDVGVEAERAAVLADIASLRDDMYNYPMRLALDAAWAGHPYGVSALGTDESVRALSAADLHEWHRARVLNGPGAIAIVGDVDPEAAASLVAAAFDRMRGARSKLPTGTRWPAAATQRVEQRAKAQTALCLAYPGPWRKDDDRHVAHLLAGIASGLGGRFFDELREKRSLAYTVVASARERMVGGAFLSYIATSPEREAEARTALLAEFAKLRTEPVHDDELERAKVYAIGTHAIRQQSGGAVLAELVDAWLMGYGLEELDEYETRVRAVTPARVRSLAERYFDDRRLAEGIVRGTGRAV